MLSFQKTSCKFLVQFTTVIMLIIVTGNKVTAQSMGISSSAITPDASSILEMRTTTKGLLMPRLTTTERNAITSPATGLIIYNTTTNKFDFYNGSSWLSMISGSSAVNSVTGTSNRITIGGTAADPTVDISSSYVGQSSITTLGTIGTGVWNGTIITSGYGGTGNGFSKFSGATTSEKTYTLPDASTTILTKNYTGALATGIVKNTTSTGELTIATAGTDYLTPTGSAAALTSFPTFNQSTTGSAATLTTARNIYGNSFNGSADLTQIIASTYGGSGNGFTKFTGATTSEKTYTLPNANAMILTDNAVVTVAQGGIGVGTLTGLAKGNGTSAFTAAVAGTDYLTPTGSAAGLTSFPTLNQNTTGSAATLTTARNIHGGSFNGSADVTNIIASTFGGTGNGFTKFSGATTSEKTYTLPDANATILTDNATVTAAQGGTGNATYTVGDILYASASTTLSKLADVATGDALISGGVSAAPSWGKIGLTTHVSGTLPIANGGTNSTVTPTNGGIIYGDGTSYQVTAAGTAGQVLKSNGASVPTWADGVTIVTLGSDVANSTTTIADVTGLSFSVTSGVTYRFKALIIYTSPATGTGSRWAINGPASPTLLAYSSLYSLTATTITTNNAAAYDIPAAASSNSAATTGNIATVEGIIKPSANGTVIIRFASESNGSAITAKAGSTLTWW